MQFDRKIELAIGDDTSTLILDQRLNITLRITKSLENNEPDTCEAEIYNMNREHRNFIGSSKKMMSAKIGYEDNLANVFIGDIQHVSHIRKGPDWITLVRSGDKANALRTAVMNKTYVGEVRLENQLKDLAESFSSELELLGEAEFKKSILKRSKSYTLDSKTHMNQIAKEHGLDWAIQDGKLVIVKSIEHRVSDPFILNYSTGLLNSPEVSLEDKTKTLRARAVSLLNNQFKPGNLVVIDSAGVTGRVGNTQVSVKNQGKVLVNIKNVVFNANSRSGEFTSVIEGRIL